MTIQCQAEMHITLTVNTSHSLKEHMGRTEAKLLQLALFLLRFQERRHCLGLAIEVPEFSTVADQVL